MPEPSLERLAERIDNHIGACEDRWERHLQQHHEELARAETARKELKESLGKVHTRLDDFAKARSGRMMTTITILSSVVVALIALAATLFGQLSALTG